MEYILILGLITEKFKSQFFKMSFDRQNPQIIKSEKRLTDRQFSNWQCYFYFAQFAYLHHLFNMPI